MSILSRLLLTSLILSVALWNPVSCFPTDGLASNTSSSNVTTTKNETTANTTSTKTRRPKKAKTSPSLNSTKPEATVSNKSAKKAISSALSSSMKKITPRALLSFLNNHRFQITLAVAAVAFRRELAQLALRCVTKPVADTSTGEIRRVVALSPSRVFQLLIVVELARRIQSLRTDDSKSNMSPLAAILLMAPSRNAKLAGLLGSTIFNKAASTYVPPVKQHYTFEALNLRYGKDMLAYSKVQNPVQMPSSKGPGSDVGHQTVVVLDWTKLGTSVSRLGVLRDEISFLIQTRRTLRGSNVPVFEEVVVVLESPGGGAADYGLAAQQLLRLRNEGVQVTVCVDKVAASGGYMIACTASPGCLLAAPFAVLGSIGVLGQTVNIQKTLEGWGIRPLVFKGGRDKAPVGLIGEVTRDGLAKVQQMVDKTHKAFQRHVSDCRPVVADNIHKLATGDVWLGTDAKDVGLVDRIITSDAYLQDLVASGVRVLKLVQIIRSRSPFVPITTTGDLSQYHERPTLLSLFYKLWMVLVQYWRGGSVSGGDENFNGDNNPHVGADTEALASASRLLTETRMVGPSSATC